MESSGSLNTMSTVSASMVAGLEAVAEEAGTPLHKAVVLILSFFESHKFKIYPPNNLPPPIPENWGECVRQLTLDVAFAQYLITLNHLSFKIYFAKMMSRITIVVEFIKFDGEVGYGIMTDVPVKKFEELDNHPQKLAAAHFLSEILMEAFKIMLKHAITGMLPLEFKPSLPGVVQSGPKFRDPYFFLIYNASSKSFSLN